MEEDAIQYKTYARLQESYSYFMANQKKKGWQILKFRPDKNTPNPQNIVDKIFSTIKENLTAEVLVEKWQINEQQQRLAQQQKR